MGNESFARNWCCTSHCEEYNQLSIGSLSLYDKVATLRNKVVRSTEDVENLTTKKEVRRAVGEVNSWIDAIGRR